MLLQEGLLAARGGVCACQPGQHAGRLRPHLHQGVHGLQRGCALDRHTVPAGHQQGWGCRRPFGIRLTHLSFRAMHFGGELWPSRYTQLTGVTPSYALVACTTICTGTVSGEPACLQGIHPPGCMSSSLQPWELIAPWLGLKGPLPNIKSSVPPVQALPGCGLS